MSDDLFEIFKEEKAMCKYMTRANFIFKTAWNFLCEMSD